MVDQLIQFDLIGFPFGELIFFDRKTNFKRKNNFSNEKPKCYQKSEFPFEKSIFG